MISVKKVGEAAFQNCEKLEVLDASELEKIDQFAFESCESISQF